MGHSAGGLYIREYAREFPAKVAGIALIDSSSPRQIDELPGFRATYEEDKSDAKRGLWEALYDNQTRSMLQGPQRFARAGSQSYPTPAAVPNADASTTIYFGPT